jgi:hypothetical protein
VCEAPLGIREVELFQEIAVARKGRPGKKQTGWCSDNQTGGGKMAKQKDKT